MPRPRSVSAHRKVLDAAVELVAERGVDAASMDAIAARSGVSKATIYKHWKDKDALLLEVMASANRLHERPTFDSGDIRADMTAVLSYRTPDDDGMRERLWPHFAAYSARNPEFGDAWRHMVMEPPRKELRALLQRGVAKGELSGELDPDSSLALLLGPILYWHIFFKRHSLDPRPLAETVVAAFWRAYGLKKARHAGRKGRRPRLD